MTGNDAPQPYDDDSLLPLIEEKKTRSPRIRRGAWSSRRAMPHGSQGWI